MKNYVLDMTDNQFKTTAKSIIDENYRLSQVVKWIYEKKSDSFENFTNLPEELREKFSERFFLRALRIISKEKSKVDDTTRYIFKTLDKKYFFAVFLSANGRNSVCVSSQIGCPVMCAFCYSGKVKFTRNLSRGEIIEQVLQIENDTKKKISGVLFMGMGEPMLNFTNVVFVLNSLLSNKEFGIGKRHITVSSVGIVPAIKKLADKNLGIRLALSLHTVDEKRRKRLISNNFSFKIEDILNAGRYYIEKTNSHLTIEYTLMKKINNSSADAHKLARLLKRHKLINSNVNVNLIPFNPLVCAKFQPPEHESIQKFKDILRFNKVVVNIRQAKGVDINAACGQLGDIESIL
ncbi:MAG: 23S rRNA (adenine(2503)-C(2))-methyltransferase RlmN [Endomicrobium sp.]|jgi:23S rRNA (adenine2503-C2)-methyltransferase|nr:23S rRNA (adenine(2503)-C(2))-methyltransferase RlmN [Endomicrobium sp.]